MQLIDLRPMLSRSFSLYLSRKATPLEYMGSGCCGRLYEGKNQTETGGVLIRRKSGSKAFFSDPIVNSPLPNLTKDYLSIPNRFVSVQRKQSLVGTTGLENQDNTCFINAALQCISNAVPLTDYFLTNVYLQEINRKNPLGTGGELAGAYAELLAVQWRDVNESMLPRRLLDQIFFSAPQFANGGQHDAHEFLAFFLDKIHEDLNRGSCCAKVHPINDSKPEKEEKRAARAWYTYLKRNSSVIVDLFQGQLRSSIRCGVCGFVSTTFDTFMYLSLPLPKGDKPITLVDCLLEFTKDEALDPDQWRCPKCKNAEKAYKKIDIWKVPPILIIHLKRFSFSSGAGKRSTSMKLTNKVEFPLSGLDVSEYVSSLQKEPPVYDLFALTNHYGYMDRGHYTAYCKNRHSQLWYKFDDTLVQEGSEAEVCSEKAYMLFYCKVSITEYRRQCSEMPNLWPHVISRKLSDLGEEVVHEQTGSTLSGFNELDLKPKEAPKSQLHVIQSQSESPVPDN